MFTKLWNRITGKTKREEEARVRRWISVFESLHQRALAQKLESPWPVIPDRTLGICQNARNLYQEFGYEALEAPARPGHRPTYNTAITIVSEFGATWPLSATPGLANIFPVPMRFMIEDRDKWGGEQLDLRISLIEHIIENLQKHGIPKVSW